MGVSISEQSAARIKSVVQRVEGTPLDMIGSTTGPQASTGEFFGKITGSSGLAHSWVHLVPDGAGAFTENAAVTGSGNAYELMGATNVPNGTVVKLSCVGPNTGKTGLVFMFAVGGGNCTCDGDTVSIGSASTSLTANTASIDDAAGKVVSATFMWRWAYDAAAGSLYGFYRTMAFCNVKSVTGETKQLITSTDPC